MQSAFTIHVALLTYSSKNLVDQFIILPISDFARNKHTCWEYNNWNVILIQQPTIVKHIKGTATEGIAILRMLGFTFPAFVEFEPIIYGVLQSSKVFLHASGETGEGVEANSITYDKTGSYVTADKTSLGWRFKGCLSISNSEVVEVSKPVSSAIVFLSTMENQGKQNLWTGYF